MCGISAVLSRPGSISRADFMRFNQLIAHRGPDGEGFAYFNATSDHFPDDSWTVGLAHRRLSIIDLTDTGRQPMAYSNGELQIVFNGEIYNYVELKAELLKRGLAFVGTSDTEVILAAYRHWGVKCFELLRGMWAVILWDRKKNKVIVSRDRLGIKPLYYYRCRDRYIAFASEIKQFTALKEFVPRGNLAVIHQYLQSGFEGTSQTFFENVVPVLPGTYQEVDGHTLELSKPVHFWKPGRIRATVADPREAAELLRAALDESVKIHLRSDVPVGCQLSGGLDSSTIFSFMQQHYQGAAIHSFTVSFPGYEKDESPFVHAMLSGSAAHAHFTTPTPEDFKAEIGRFVWHHDEPVGSFAHYAGFVLARLIASQRIKVVLNGQGGDEILGGYWQQYNAYLLHSAKRFKLWQLIGHLAGALMPQGNSELIKQMPAMMRRFVARKKTSQFQITDRMRSVTYENYLNHYFEWNEQERRVFDIRNLILPRLLKWDDRNLMAFSVEGRYPFLDHQVIETALQFDYRALFSKGWTKYPLRLSMSGRIPRAIYARKSKWGFETPQQSWLSDSLRPMLQSWLQDRNKPIYALVTAPSLTQIAQRFWGKASLEDAQLLFRLFLLDQWLQIFNIHIEE
ncbi:MAG: asparagine synthase (glutamine-hydrolyzing) [Bacteroidota bacterium]